MASIKVDSYLEVGYVAALKAAGTYFTDNSIPVITFHDDSVDKVLPCVTVHAEPAEELESVLGLWSSRISIKCETKPEDDKDGAIKEAMNDAVQGIVIGTTPDALHAFCGSPLSLAISRIWHITGDHSFDESGKEQSQECKFEVISEAGLA